VTRTFHPAAALLALGVLASAIARAEEPATGAPPPSPAPQVETPPPAPEPLHIPPTEPQVLAGTLRSPHHPQNRWLTGVSLGVGLLCPDYSTTSVSFHDWCTLRIRLGVDFPFADVHVGLLGGHALSVGGQLGFELGTPYFRLRRGRVAIALRMSVDGMLNALGVDTPGHAKDGLLALTNTFGPNLSIAVGRGTTIELRLAGGWSVAGFFSNEEGFARALFAAVGDFWLGVRWLP
jgi:hypothetical protein